MTRRRRLPAASAAFAAATVLLAPFASAQEPVPSAELKKLAPLVGAWTGKGEFREPGQTSKWEATGGYAWVLDGFWLRGAFEIHFEGLPTPMYHEQYFGWDAERQGFVAVSFDNGGTVALNELQLSPDGAIVEMSLLHQPGLTLAQRSSIVVKGDTLLHTVDMLMPQGPALPLVDGTFTRAAKVPDVARPAAAIVPAPPNPALQKLAAWAGSYNLSGAMTVLPGTPPLRLQGTDTYTPLFSGLVVHAHTDGTVDGSPQKYQADTFYGWDPQKNCITSVMVSNMGECGTIDWRFAADGKACIGTVAAPYQGQPTISRSIVDLDGKGQPTGVHVDTIVGTSPAYEGFRVTYQKK